jgi:hypothetical protein
LVCKLLALQVHPWVHTSDLLNLDLENSEIGNVGW